jgi:hypothetical protein
MPPRFVCCHNTVLVRPLGPHAWLGRLPNGHELAVLLPRTGLAAAARPAAGSRVTVEISPADFTHGRLVPGAESPGAIS